MVCIPREPDGADERGADERGAAGRGPDERDERGIVRVGGVAGKRSSRAATYDVHAPRGTRGTCRSSAERNFFLYGGGRQCVASDDGGRDADAPRASRGASWAEFCKGEGKESF